MGKRVKGLVGTSQAGFTKTEYDGAELRKWVTFAFIGTYNGAIPVKGADLNAEEINAACNTTIVLARMLRVGRRAWRMRQ